MLALYPVLPWWQQGLVRGSSTSSPADFLAAAPLPPAPTGSAGAPGWEPLTPVDPPFLLRDSPPPLPDSPPPLTGTRRPCGIRRCRSWQDLPAPGGIRRPFWLGAAAPCGIRQHRSWRDRPPFLLGAAVPGGLLSPRHLDLRGWTKPDLRILRANI